MRTAWQAVEYTFDRLRFQVEEAISHPFNQERYDSRGRKARVSDKPRKENWVLPWKAAGDLLIQTDEARRSLYGVSYSDPAGLLHNQCRFRGLVAQCLAFIEEYDAAIRELRLAVGGLDSRTPKDRFLLGVIHGILCQTYLLRSDSMVRRRWDDTGILLIPGPRFDRSSILKGLRCARNDLDRAKYHLGCAEDLIRGIRMNASRWEWLCELRIQLVLERVLIHTVELDFDIGMPVDDWKLIGTIQRDMTEGLEAIRGGLDSTVYPHQLLSGTPGGTKMSGDQFASAFSAHRRLLGAWMRLMLGSFWLLRLSTIVDSSRGEKADRNRVAPRLEALNRFETHGSQSSFWRRWEALNQAVGLDRLVAQNDSLSTTAIAKTGGSSREVNSMTPWRGDVAKHAIAAIAGTASTLIYGKGADKNDPPFMAREFVLEQMAQLCNQPDGMNISWVEYFQDSPSGP